MLNIELKFNIEDYFGLPLCRIIVDDSAATYDGPVRPEMNLSIPVTTGEHELRIVHYGKINQDHLMKDGKIIKDKHFELTALNLDGVELKEELWEGAFFPVYGQDYVNDCKKNNINLQYSISPNLYFGYNGTWKLSFFYPVYPWLIKKRAQGLNLSDSIFRTSDQMLKQAKEYFSNAPDITWKV